MRYWKYAAPLSADGMFANQVPIGARFLPGAIGHQPVESQGMTPDGHRIMVWPLVDSAAPLQTRYVYLSETGREIPEWVLANGEYLGQVQIYDGIFVAHVWAIRPLDAARPYRVLFYDPTCNPATVFHVEAVKKAHQAGQYEMVFITTPADHRDKPDILPWSHRLEMLSLAFGDVPYAIVRTDLMAPGRVYSTAKSLQAIQREIPSVQLEYLLGEDALETLSTWRDADRLLQHVRLVVVPRGEPRIAEIVERDPLLMSYRSSISVLNGPVGEGSSTEVRRLIRSGEPYEGLVPARVAAYIRQKQLYP